jgi:hypothetical protein
LLVDDHRMMRQGLRSLLENHADKAGAAVLLSKELAFEDLVTTIRDLTCGRAPRRLPLPAEPGT